MTHSCHVTFVIIKIPKGGINIMSLKIELIERKKQNVLSVKTRAAVQDLPKIIGESYGKIMSYLTELGEYPSDAPFVGYFNMDMNDLDLEIGFPVAKNLDGKNEIISSEIPEGKYVTCRHIGSYENFEKTYTAIMAWMSANNYEMSGKSYEVYLNDPSTVSPDELLTDIFILIK